MKLIIMLIHVQLVIDKIIIGIQQKKRRTTKPFRHKDPVCSIYKDLLAELNLLFIIIFSLVYNRLKLKILLFSLP